MGTLSSLSPASASADGLETLLRTERTYAEIHLDRLGRNLGRVRRLIPPGCKVMSVLKADAYGHGLAVCARFMEPFTDAFAVATLEEALTVRRSGVKKTVLLLGILKQQEVSEAAAAEITCNLCGLAYARMLSQTLEGTGQIMKGHIEFDTGMNRTGIRLRPGEEQEAVEIAEEICRLPNIHVTGTFTHFSCAEAEDGDSREETDRQYASFHKACKMLEEAGYHMAVRHTSSTGPLLIRPEYCMDMVRVGMLPYGMSISTAYTKKLGLEPVMTWYGRIDAVREVPAGEAVGYERVFRVQCPSRIAVISAGYADGYPYGLGNQGHVQIAGKNAYICGKLCMDFLMADVTDIPDARPGDTAILLGGLGEKAIHANFLAERLPYGTCGGITAGIGLRVPRVYYENGVCIKISRAEWKQVPVSYTY